MKSRIDFETEEKLKRPRLVVDSAMLPEHRDARAEREVKNGAKGDIAKLDTKSDMIHTLSLHSRSLSLSLSLSLSASLCLSVCLSVCLSLSLSVCLSLSLSLCLLQVWQRDQA